MAKINIFLILSFFFIAVIFLSASKPKSIHLGPTPPTPTPYQFPYKNPVIPKNRSYRIVIVGDSIVHALGVNANTLRLDLIKYFPDSEFVTYNYGYPSTNVLTLYDRLQNSILKQTFELIIIESFGNNPLSQYPLNEGLQKQTEELDRSVRLILSQKPHAALAFLTPIALDPNNYARGTVALSQTARQTWVTERIAYIQNHKKYAEDKGIPVIDVYSLSLKSNGQVNRLYISDDSIHPSQAGVNLISQAIADYIFRNKILPP